MSRYRSILFFITLFSLLILGPTQRLSAQEYRSESFILRDSVIGGSTVSEGNQTAAQRSAKPTGTVRGDSTDQPWTWAQLGYWLIATGALTLVALGIYVSSQLKKRSKS